MRAIAVLSLRKLALQSNQRVLDILTGVGQDPFENDRVRIIALVLLVSTNPPAFRWQKIAFSTWFEPSPQVASFTYDILYNLARSDHIDCSLRQLWVFPSGDTVILCYVQHIIPSCRFYLSF